MGPRRHGTDMLTAALVEKGRHRPSSGSARLEHEPCKEPGWVRKSSIDQEHMMMMTMRATSGYRGVGVLGGKSASGKTTGGPHLSSVSNLPR